MTAVLQYFWLGQKITVNDGISMVGSFGGIIMIGLSAPPTIGSTKNHAYLLGIVCSVASAICLSFIFVATNRMKSIHYLVISLYLGVLTGGLSSVGMLIQYFVDGRVPFQGLGLVPWMELSGAGISNLIGVSLSTMAFQ